MKKFVLKLDFQDDRELQRKALKTVCSLTGIDEISIDLKGKKLTVTGTVDPVSVVSKLRKQKWTVEFISCGPKEEPKKEEPKKEEGKKEEPKKEEGKKEEGKKEEGKKEGEAKKKPDPVSLQTAAQYRPFYPPMQRPFYPPMYHPSNPINHSIEENPNACVIA